MNNSITTLQQRDYLIPVLGLCPLLAAVNNPYTGMAMGLIVLLAITLVSALHATTRSIWPVSIRLVVMVLINTVIISLIHMFMQFWFYELSQQLGLYIQLLALNCVVLALAEDAYSRGSTIQYLSRTVLAGLSIVFVLVGAGAIREYAGLTLLQQPFGVFFILALALAAYRCRMMHRHKVA